MEADVVVVGAGTAGSNVARQLADRGLSVVLVERREIGSAGARWHNGVLEWQFERAGLQPPEPPELSHAASAFHMFGPSGNHAFTIAEPPTVTADMALLGDRLRAMCRDAGVVMVERAANLRTRYDGNRLVGVGLTGRRVDRPLDDADAPTERFDIRARLFVDASGRAGVLGRSSAVLERWCPIVRKDELCSASDFRFHIDDRDGASDFLRRHGAEPGDRINTVGLAGGYSTRNMSISDDLSQVSVLVGCIANGRYGTGPRMLEQVRRSERWIGDPISGGSGVIPLRRPYARFTAPGLALVGDAACQVFPAHGSGIGMGLIAGHLLAESVATADDIGDESTLWRYQHAFMSEFGGLLIAFDAFRRMSTALGAAGVDKLMRADLVNDEMTRAGLDQRLATPDPAALPLMALKLFSRPRLAAAMLPMLGRVQILRVLGSRHPANPDLKALERWDRSIERVLGPLPS